VRFFPLWQRLPAVEIRIIDPARESRIALGFAFFYIAAAAVTGMIESVWPHPLWGATLLTSDILYLFAFKIGLLLVLPIVAILHAGYSMDDLMLGWRQGPRSMLTLMVVFFLGFIVNAGMLRSISDAVRPMSLIEGVSRVGLGWMLMLFCAALPEEIVYRWGLQTRLERRWGRPQAILATALLFTGWHLPTRYLLASGAEGSAGDLQSVLVGTGLPVLVVGLIFGWAWDRWRNLPALVALHWGIDTLPSTASLLHIPPGGH